MENLTWNTQRRKINDLIPFEKNPRKINEKQRMYLEDSINKFGLVEIPVVDFDNKIIAGHQRLKIMKMIGKGDEEIDVRVASRKLTDEEFNEYNIRSNKNTGEWDFDVLINSFDIEMLKEIGFGNDLDKLLKKQEDEKPELQFSEELMLEHNYVVLYFDNVLDWQVAIDKFGLKDVKSITPDKSQKIGIGRVIKGKDVIDKMN